MDLSASLQSFIDAAAHVFLSPGSVFSLTSLVCALALAAGHVVYRRIKRNRRIRPRTILAGLFPRRIWASASTMADVRLFLLNAFILGAALGWALASFQFVADGVGGALTAVFGARGRLDAPEFALRAAMTATMFLAYELGYWLDHYLAHRIPFLWEFHKVHHSAEHLTPLTVWRMHPVDTLVFANVVAFVLAVAAGLAGYLLGADVREYALSGANVLLILCVHLYLHLQHSHVWIAFRGVWGKLLMSPAHHQIHHSTNPLHFNKNLGSALSLWDWAFGTLHMPAKEKEPLAFGIDAADDVNTISAALITPFADAARRVMPGARPALAESEPSAR